MSTINRNIIFALLLMLGVGFAGCKDDDVAEKPNFSGRTTPEEKPADNPTDTPSDDSKVASGLHVDGKYLKDENGKIVNLHGFAQTYSAWFNEQGKYWSGLDVAGCMKYNKEKIDGIVKAGWHMTWMRLHMDPTWTNTPGTKRSDASGSDEADITNFDPKLLQKYLDELYVPMAEYAISKGMKVVMRPPGVCPHIITTSEHYTETSHLSLKEGKPYPSQDYQEYLKTVWNIVSQHPKLCNNPNVMFELANEPVYIWDPEAKNYGPRWDNAKGWIDGDNYYKIETEIFQSVVDVIRANGCDNVLWVPGVAYQGDYRGYAKFPIKGSNIGYAVHCYPGWFGSDGNNGDGGVGTGSYTEFRKQFDEKVGCIASKAPIIVTELDWARPEFARQGYLGTWGTGYTGEAGKGGFGANFKRIADEYGNVSWLTFVWEHHLAAFDPTHPEDGGADGTGLYDYQSGVYPLYQWFNDYYNSSIAE